MTAYTATLNGLVIGDGTPYIWQSEPTGLGVGGYTTARIRRQWLDGAKVLGPDTIPPRVVVFSTDIFDGRGYDAGGTAAVELLADDLKAAWAPVRSDVIALELELAAGARLLYGRPVAVDLDMSTALHGIGYARLVFEATDPRMFAAGAASAITLGLTAGGGMVFPLVFPLVFGAGSDSDGSATNAGNTATSWVATITGPVNTPRITLGSTGEYMELDGDVPAGSTLVVNSDDQSILLDGSPRQSWQTLLSRWWQLPVGVNTIRFRAASGSGSLNFSWRSAWL